MNQGSFDRHPGYQAEFRGESVDGFLACPSCKNTTLHPTGHTRTIRTGIEYGPSVGVVLSCECGEVAELQIGNRKGDLGMDLKPMGNTRL